MSHVSANFLQRGHHILQLSSSPFHSIRPHSKTITTTSMGQTTASNLSCPTSLHYAKLRSITTSRIYITITLPQAQNIPTTFQKKVGSDHVKLFERTKPVNLFKCTVQAAPDPSRRCCVLGCWRDSPHSSLETGQTHLLHNRFQMI